jgi:tetratricopeptide (TPR) repeat protein
MNNNFSQLTRDALTQPIKDRLKEAVKLKCEKCGNNGPKKILEVHHISEVCYADGKFDLNSPSNLIVLCSNCHGLVHDGQITELELRNCLYNRSESVRYDIDKILKDRNIVTIEKYGEKAIELDSNFKNNGDRLEYCSYLLRRGLIDDAIKEFNNIIINFPEHAMAHYELGNIYSGKQKLNEAINEYVDCLNSTDTFVKVYTGYSANKIKGNAFLKIGDLRLLNNQLLEALEAFTLAVMVNPTNEAIDKLINILGKLGFTSNDIVNFKNIIVATKNVGTYSDIYLYLGDMFYIKGLYEYAIPNYLEALKSDTKSSKIHCALGDCYFFKNEYNEALKEYFTLIIFTAPDYLDSLYNDGLKRLGGILISKGLNEAEALNFIKNIKMYKYFYDLFYDIGNILYYKQNYDCAINEYKEVIKLKPDYAEAYNNLGNCYNTKNQLNEAINAYNLAIRYVVNKDTAIIAYYNLGSVYEKLDLIDDAIIAYKKVIEKDKSRINAHYNLGVCYYKKGNTPEAISEFELSLKRNYNKPYAHYYLGKIFCNLNDNKKAIEHYKLAVKLKPDYTEVINELNKLLEESRISDDTIETNQSSLVKKDSLFNRMLRKK